MALTAAEMLNEIDTAILEVLQDGQSVLSNGKAYNRANLKDLRDLRDNFASIVSSQSGGALSRAVAGIPRRG